MGEGCPQGYRLNLIVIIDFIWNEPGILRVLKLLECLGRFRGFNLQDELAHRILPFQREFLDEADGG